ncbi:proprotein convertase P-domain-containing protein [Akkermansiaceae bacterium]|nr:proprotein convertase P-domain-containing protein [Akkermansiaceae bacterium]MDA8976874.1 proprotein convertase P-domain-containing protein [bacterium]MDB4370299.1 proprotein convertase P-domain-containing protein [Akkermansiaceae bacterium]MDB4382981.1 proprotein convertase P-domain-containing protein [Akkermansiaceae bacterium]
MEHVILTIDINHTHRGDLEIILVSPAGTQSILSTTNNSSEDGFDTYPFLSVRHWGERSTGTWRVIVIDRFEPDIGTLRSATLTLHGAPPSGYQNWVDENFTPFESNQNDISGGLADPDLDGRNNLLEYAFNGDPKTAEATLPGEPKIVKANGQNKLRFTRDTAKSDIQYTLTRSAGLVGSWLELPTTEFSTEGTLEVRELVLDSTQKQFFRIEISR